MRWWNQNVKHRLEALHASLRERRVAAIVAGACLMLIATLAIRPDLIRSTHTSAGQRASEQILPLQPTADNPPAITEPEASPTPKMEEAKAVPSNPETVNPSVTHPPKIEPDKSLKQASEPTRKMRASPAPPGYYVQVGAFSDVARARALQKKIMQRGWPARLIEKGGSLMAVVIGPYDSRQKAAGKQQEIMRTFRLKGYPIQYTPAR
ncbi:MAG: hypothetical protein D6703_06400 [Zetaproteobacteria bacterium]|nr:MAG: hypothetical protein D6703_06400 [Zetaproteobacteria bacterium]